MSTTDPAAHIAGTVAGELPGLRVSRIDPKEETRRYIDKIMAAQGPDLDEQECALLLEDLRSPCTEEVAVFHAFSRIVQQARSAFVVLDTAPTGHTLLLMDAIGAYHRQITQGLDPRSMVRIATPLMRLQDPAYTRIILVTLPEITPVSQAVALQEDLQRAHRAFRAGREQEHLRCRDQRSLAAGARRKRTGADGANRSGADIANVHRALADYSADRRRSTVPDCK